MKSKIQEYTTDSAEFLIDVRSLPLEIQWKIQGMIELFNFLKVVKPQALSKTTSSDI